MWKQRCSKTGNNEYNIAVCISMTFHHLKSIGSYECVRFVATSRHHVNFAGKLKIS